MFVTLPIIIFFKVAIKVNCRLFISRETEVVVTTVSIPPRSGSLHRLLSPECQRTIRDQ